MISFGRPDKIEKYGPLGGTPRCVIFGDFCVKTRVFFGFFLEFQKKHRVIPKIPKKSKKNPKFLPKTRWNSKNSKNPKYCKHTRHLYRDLISIETSPASWNRQKHTKTRAFFGFFLEFWQKARVFTYISRFCA